MVVRRNTETSNITRICMIVLISIIASLVVEVFIFNYRHFESLTFTENQNKEIALSKINPQDLVEKYHINDLKDDNTYLISDNTDIKVDNISLENMPINPKDSKPPIKTQQRIEINIYIRDEGNNIFSKYPSYILDISSDASKYLRIHTYGNLSQILIGIKSINLDDNAVTSLNANTLVPFQFSVQRYLMLVLISLIAIFLLPRMEILNRIGNKRTSKILVLSGIVVIQVLILLLIAFGNLEYDFTQLDELTQHKQYAMLAQSLLEGRFNLDLDVNQGQTTSLNPYDYKYLSSQGINSYWDCAYFNGNYYCYFGILPVLLFYLPYLIITGESLKTYVVVVITFILVTLSLLFLLSQIKKRYFENISFRNFIILDILLFIGSGCLVFALNPTFYSMIIMLGVSFMIIGYGFWLKASNDHKYQYYLIGSIFNSLVILTRPPLLLGTLLVIPFAIIPLFRGKSNTNSKIYILIINAIPYVVIGCFQMYYNYKRFGNPFDFGANYNMTTNDMTHRGLVFDRLFPGIFEYLIQFPITEPKFPFITPINLNNINIDYQGITIMEECFGGYFWLCPISLYSIGLLSKKFRTGLRSNPHYREISSICATTSIVAIIIILLDTQMAGILFRYIQDFGIFLSIESIAIVGILLNKVSKLSNQPTNIKYKNANELAFQKSTTNSITTIDDNKLSISLNKIFYSITLYTATTWTLIVIASQ